MTLHRHPTVFAAVLLAVALIAFPVAADEPEPPPAYDGQTVALQSLGAAGVAAGLSVGAGVIMARNLPTAEGTVPFDVMLGAGLLIGALPILAPIPVNMIGTARGYPRQRLGAHLGGPAGAFIGLGTMIGVSMAVPDSDLLAGPGLFGGFVLGAVAGTVVGYHMQAAHRQRDNGTEAQITPTLQPVAEPATDRWGVTAGWQGRF